jgi:RNA polymerase sigma-70 factor (ECF subfamily)
MRADTEVGRGVTPAGGSGHPVPEKSKAFLRLFLQNERRLYAYVFTLLANRTDAEDVLQDASLLMWEKFDPTHPPDDFAAWGCRIAYYKVLEFHKSARRGRARLGRLMLERVGDTAVERAGVLELDDRREALAGCLDKLTPRDRDLLDRRFADGATTRSTSEQLGRSVEAVYKALAKVQQSLFDCVQRTLSREGRS